MSDMELATALQQLTDADAGQRQLAVMALEELADGSSVEPLIAALRDPDATVRRLAVGVLAIKRGRIKQLAIDELEVGRLHVKELIVDRET